MIRDYKSWVVKIISLSKNYVPHFKLLVNIKPLFLCFPVAGLKSAPFTLT
jgi:hypothetical protein